MKKLIIFNFALLFIIGLMTVTTHCSTKRHWSKRERYAQKNLPSRPAEELEKKNAYGFTPLTCAVSFNNLKEVRKLLKEGANPRNSLLDAVWITRNPLMFAELLRYGAQVNAKNPGGNTPLHQAAVSGNDVHDTVEFFLKSGAHPNAQNNRNETPFLQVMRKVSYLKQPVKTIKMFLDFQADPLLKDNYNNSPFTDSLYIAPPEIILLMIENEHVWPALKAFNPSAESMEIVNEVNAKIVHLQEKTAWLQAAPDTEKAINELKAKVAVLESPKKQSELVVEVQQKIRTALCPQYSVAWLKNREIGFKRNLPKKSAISSDAADFEQKEN